MRGFIRVLAGELSAVTPLDAAAYFDESLDKVEWHFDSDPGSLSSLTADHQNEEALAHWLSENGERFLI
jgi:hypothetical protein